MDVEQYLECRRVAVGMDLKGDTPTRHPHDRLFEDLREELVPGPSQGSEDCHSLVENVLDALNLIQNLAGLVAEDGDGLIGRSTRAREWDRMKQEDLYCSHYRSKIRAILCLMHAEDTRSAQFRLVLETVSSRANDSLQFEDRAGARMRKEQREDGRMLQEELTTQSILLSERIEQSKHYMEDLSSMIVRMCVLFERRGLMYMDLFGRLQNESLRWAVVAVQSWWRCFILRKRYKNVFHAARHLQTGFKHRRALHSIESRDFIPPKLGSSDKDEEIADPLNDYMNELISLDHEYISNCDEVLRGYRDLDIGDENVGHWWTVSDSNRKESLPCDNPQIRDESSEDKSNSPARSHETGSVGMSTRFYTEVGLRAKRKPYRRLLKSSAWY